MHEHADRDHTEPPAGVTCARCGEPALGFATINGDRYCHADERSCYTEQCRENPTHARLKAGIDARRAAREDAAALTALTALADALDTTPAELAAGPTPDGTDGHRRGPSGYRCCRHCKDDTVHDVATDSHDSPCQTCDDPGAMARELHTRTIAELERLQVTVGGADPTPVPENARPTAGQLWHQLLTAPLDERLDQLGRMIDAQTEIGKLHQRLADAERSFVDVCGRLERRESTLADERARTLAMAERHSEALHRATERAKTAEAKVARAEGLIRRTELLDGDPMDSWVSTRDLRAALAGTVTVTTKGPGGITPGGMSVCPTCGRWGSGGGLCLDAFHEATPAATEGGA